MTTMTTSRPRRGLAAEHHRHDEARRAGTKPCGYCGLSSRHLVDDVCETCTDAVAEPGGNLAGRPRRGTAAAMRRHPAGPVDTLAGWIRSESHRRALSDGRNGAVLLAAADGAEVSDRVAMVQA